MARKVLTTRRCVICVPHTGHILSTPIAWGMKSNISRGLQICGFVGNHHVLCSFLFGLFRNELGVLFYIKQGIQDVLGLFSYTLKKCVSMYRIRRTTETFISTESEKHNAYKCKIPKQAFIGPNRLCRSLRKDTSPFVITCFKIRSSFTFTRGESRLAVKEEQCYEGCKNGPVYLVVQAGNPPALGIPLAI